MKKIVILSSLFVVALSADMLTNVAKDAALSQVKSEARTTAVNKVAGDNPLTKKLANSAADKVLGKEDPVEKVKANAVSSLLGAKGSQGAVLGATGAAALVGGTTQGNTSLKDTAVDMAAQKAEDTVGKETLEKETAKALIKSAL